MTTGSEAIRAAPAAADLLAGYAPVHGVHDELLDSGGAVRPHWRALLDGLAALSPAERAQRAERLNRLVRETGIAHDIFADPGALRQPWQVDQVPLILPPAEWAFLERALVQRARLFDALLADLYGPRELLRSGLVPPALVFSDTAYLRPCHGIAGKGQLHFYAADLARDPSGDWRILDNHTETLAGTGFVIANRMVHVRVAGDLLVASRGLRLAPFFQRLQSTLAGLVAGDDPRIALLTPGPHHPDYFSHAYLARYLGWLLVEGGDLRSVGERVYLKTIEGLRPIDLIVRCVEAALADPLELDPAGFLGPAGLVRAARRNPGLVANALGSSVVENRGLGAYLPALARHLLGEDLLIPDAPRWWLGDAASRAHVLANPERMLIRVAHEGTGRPGTAEPGRPLSGIAAEELARLEERIAIDGATLVAEEQQGFGTTPDWSAGGLVARPYAVRLFAAATADGYNVMPGGLAMTVDPQHALALSAPESATRDVWVLSERDPGPHVSLWRPALETARVQRSQHGLQSRVADNQFWLGRYAERADWTMRVLRSALGRQADDGDPGYGLAAVHASLGLILARDGLLPAAGFDADDADGLERTARELLASTRRLYGLRRSLDHLHRLASLTRDRLSLEAWRTLDVFRPDGKWPRDAPPVSTGEALDLLHEGLAALAGFNGLMHENMTRNHGWRLLDTGRRLERAHGMAELLLEMFGRIAGPAEARGDAPETPDEPPEESGTLNYVLELADCFITYRSRYRMSLELALVLDLLMLDESNPRSLAFQLVIIAEHLDKLPRTRGSSERTGEQRLIMGLLTRLALCEPGALAARRADGSRGELADVLGTIVAAMPELSEAITRRYFSLTVDGPKRVRTRRERGP